MLPIAVGVAESLVVLVLVALIAMPGAQATDDADAAARAELASRSRDVISIGKLVQTAYPDRELAAVLARPVPQTTGVDDFDVELVLRGEGACWIQVGVTASGLATRLTEAPGLAPRGRPSCPEPLPAASQPPLDGGGVGPK